MAKIIHRTGVMREGLKNQAEITARFILGRRVKIGRVYSSCNVINGITHINGDCIPVYYDAPTRRLIVRASDKPYSLIFLEGDIVSWRDGILASHGGSALHFSGDPVDAIDDLIGLYSDGADLSEETVFAVLRRRFCKYPPGYLRTVARMYMSICGE